MDNFDKKIVKKFCEETIDDTSRFSYFKQFLTPTEQAIFYDFYYGELSIVQIALIENYSEIQVKRILKSARKKIYKRIP